MKIIFISVLRESESNDGDHEFESLQDLDFPGFKYISYMTMFSFSKGDSNRSAFATRMLLYIEPLLLRFKKELMGVKITGLPLVLGGHVEDQFLLVECDEDIRCMWGIVESFEDYTNALINRQKTRILGLSLIHI